MFERESNTGTILLSLLVGSIIGAGVAMLFTPYSGKKMRGRIVDMADDAKDYASDYAKRLKNRVS